MLVRGFTGEGTVQLPTLLGLFVGHLVLQGGVFRVGRLGRRSGKSERISKDMLTSARLMGVGKISQWLAASPGVCRQSGRRVMQAPCRHFNTLSARP